MINKILEQFSSQIITVQYLILIINALVHLLFAGAVAQDAGKLNKRGIKTALVAPFTWAFATLVGGLVTAAVYWFIHHSTLTRSLTRDTYNER